MASTTSEAVNHTDTIPAVEALTEGGKSNHPAVAVETKELSPRSVHGFSWVIAVSAILSSTFLFALDNTVVADVQPAILNTFGQIEDLPWLGVAFALGGIAILPWGKAYSIFNIKWLYITTVILFEAGSALCGGAPNMNALIVGRAIAGLGGSGMYSGCLTYLSVTTNNRERPLYMALVLLAWGLGTVLGPIIGGAFADSSATWRWSFYINLVIGAIFSPAYFLTLPNIDFGASLSLVQKLAKMDWIGMVVFFAGATCLTMAISFGGTTYAWNSGSEIAFWVVSGVLLIVMAVITVRPIFVSKADRLYPGHFVRKLELVNLQIQLFLVTGVMMGTAYYIPLYFQFAREDSALRAAVRLLPFITMAVCFCVISGALMPIFGYYMPWYTWGSALVLIGSALMYTVDANTSPSHVYGYTVLLGIGAGSYLQAGYAIVQMLVPPEEVGNAVGFMSVSQDLGIVFILALAGTVYQNLALKRLTPLLAGRSAADVSQVIAGTSNSVFKSLDPNLQTKVVDEITKSMSVVWAILIGVGALCLILSLFLKRQRAWPKTA
ncbi:efflux pump antibiotic resistance protein, putative [Talaromyces stipitatus ATCC 10500]|uniref:Efflux pump antibiotic resistance protein, putative n=1 Tax=Talaromyces stipitatus (strain ATCC 10500 / CBS 375.48 / QM 6759 / NRRL 1006) TaxID=441959 RepID=B8M9Y0_TALSN|nr:efflux pump antibiotic resistance protein, putative [Talaromyces stipitatus ATCC 10500]EED18132.1 efflux pump antibiotic resistance protein, putative [Talaromyces stipitatus ATCC 10500]